MKKITENQLKDRVSSLREYLKVYEAGMQAQGDDDGNTTITRPDGSTMVVGPDGKQIMPGSNPNLPQNKGVGNTISNWWNNKGDFQKPGGFQPAPAAPAALANQGASVTPAAPTSTQVQTDDDGNHTITTPDGKTVVVGPDGNAIQPGSNPNLPQNKGIADHQKKVARAKELLAMAFAKDEGVLENHLKESTSYFLNKLRLIESRQLNEKLSTELRKELDTLMADLGSAEDGMTPEVSELVGQYSSLKNQAAAVTTAKAWPTTREAIIAFQKANGLVPDGLIGRRTYTALTKQGYSAPVGFGIVPDRPGQNQGASTRPTAPTAPTAPELTQTQQNLKNYGMYKPGDELRTPTEIAASAGLADATPNPDAGLAVSDPRHSGYAAWKKKQDDLAAAASQNAPDGVNNTVTRQVAGTRGGPNNNGRLGLQPRRQTQAESVGYNELQRIVSLVNHR
jgi:peptidoglycan hydrolase-like protein with peptidoglycan-binding domain